MSFLTPWSALAAAAITIPLLLLLYFLKLRRQALRIPSTLLWQRSFEDLQVNVPFQRLRFTPLLLLQLLILIGLLLALAQPMIRATAAPPSRLVLLIDRSASMGATDAGTDEQPATRLDAARAAARRIIDQMDRHGGGGEAMVVSFAAQARVQCGFESDRRIVLEAIDGIEPGDGEADLAAALHLAEAFAARREETGSQPPEVILLSDGGVRPPDEPVGFSLSAGDFRFVPAGPGDGADVDNLGIAALTARRDHQDPSQVLVFARLLNAGPRPVAINLAVRLDDRIVQIRSLEVPAADEAGPGTTATTFAVEMAGGAVITVRHDRKDSLPADDTAAVVMPSPGRPRIALVHEGLTADSFIEEAVAALQPAVMDVMTRQRFEGIDPYEIDRGLRYDLVIFDRVSPRSVPGVPSLTFAGVLPGIEALPDPPPEGQRLISWERRHPVMRHVEPDRLLFTGATGYGLPAGATSLAVGPGGPVIAELASRGTRHLLVAFEPAASTWPVDVSFTIFMLNAAEYLTLAAAGDTALGSRPGEPVTVRAGPETERLRIDGPEQATIEVSPGEARTLAGPERAGLYTIEGAVPPMDRLAVSVLSDVESDLRPRRRLVVNATAVEAAPADRAVPRALWPWLVAAAGLLLLVEWFVYCWRISR